MAVSVIDELQGRGLGALLVRAIAELARQLGVDTLVANVLVENHAMNGLLRRLGHVSSVRTEHGVLVYEIALG